MAVTMAKLSSHMYQGLSSDTKPIPQGVNAIFYETDTKKFYIYTATGWTVSVRTPVMRYW
ncbi:MAG TPA: hypothetical protein VJQ82_25905 [Terriglobales bacterium]|nr:hypothetical protein [Terriglobales bacterium]